MIQIGNVTLQIQFVMIQLRKAMIQFEEVNSILLIVLMKFRRITLPAPKIAVMRMSFLMERRLPIMFPNKIKL